MLEYEHTANEAVIVKFASVQREYNSFILYERRIKVKTKQNR
jgi:hypothetical protein